MPYTYAELDPATDQPIKTAPQRQQTQQAQTQTAPASGQSGFDLEKFAADSATRSMMYSLSQGHRPMQSDWEQARKDAWQAGFGAMKEAQQANINRQGELAKQMQMRNYEQFGPRQMTSEELKDAEPLLNVHNQITMLQHQNEDIPANHPYRNVVTGGPGAAIGGATDARVRLYESTRDGLITTVARGLGMDTGSAAGKEQAQALFSRLMPGAGDSVEMSGRKTADMMQMELNQNLAKIQDLPQNVDTTVLKQAYAKSYNDYANLVKQYGSDAQKNYMAPSPQQLWGQNAQPPANPMVSMISGSQNVQDVNAAQSAINQPAVKAGVSPPSNAVIANLNTQVTGGPSQGQALTAGTAPNQSGSTLQSSPPNPALGAAAQQAGQYAGGSTVMTPQNMPAVQGSIGQVAVAPSAAPQSSQVQPVYGASASGPGSVGQAFGAGEQATGQGAQATLGWLQSLLPENWQQTGGQFNR
jgi:hypothetical protein